MHHVEGLIYWITAGALIRGVQFRRH